MTASLSGVYSTQQFTDAGLPASGYRLYTYSYGTTTQKVAYTDAAGSVAHTYTSDGSGGSYIALNARGELPAPLYLTTGSYDLCLKTAAGATVWTRRADPIFDTASSATTATYSLGATGAVTTTVTKRLQAEAWLTDFLPAGYVTDGSVDYTTYIQAALDSAKTVHAPEGIFLSGDVYMNNLGQRILGAGMYKTGFKLKAGSTVGIASKAYGVNASISPPSQIQGYEISDLYIDQTLQTNASTSRAVSIEYTWNVTLRNIQTRDTSGLGDTTNKYSIELGRGVYTTTCYGLDVQCINLQSDAGYTPAPSGYFGTTTNFYGCSAYSIRVRYYQIVGYYGGLLQSYRAKVDMGTACGPFTFIGNDIEGGGPVFNLASGAGTISTFGNTYQAVKGEFIHGIANLQGSSQLMDISQTFASRTVTSVSLTSNVATIQIDTTTYVGGFYTNGVPQVGQRVFVNISGSGADSTFNNTTTGVVVLSVDAVNNRFTYAATHADVASIAVTGTFTPDDAVSFRYGAIFNGYLRSDFAATRMLARQRLVMSNAQAITGFQTDGTTEKSLIQLNAGNQLELGDGSTNRWILDGPSLRSLMPGYGPQPAPTVFASLPSAVSYPYMRTAITDSNTVVFNAAAAGGGANKIPVWSDGTVWRVG
jgi:hypothetical protein